MSEIIKTTKCFCGTSIFFKNEVRSQYENFDRSGRNVVPFNADTNQPHQCSKRNGSAPGWSIWLECPQCFLAVRFNNKIVDDEGRKIMQGKDHKAHTCKMEVQK